MTIHHVVAHELVKAIDNKIAAKELNPKGAFNKNLPIVQRFIDTTDKSYKRRPKALGKFDPSEVVYPLQKILHTYLLVRKTEEDFLQMTSVAMDILVGSATNIIKASGGIVIFMHYDDSFMILLLSKKTVFNLKDFVLEDLEAMDIDAMRYAVKIDINGFLSKPIASESDSHPPYISFIRGTANVSEYFLSFIGCKDYVSPQQSTHEMIEAVRDYMNSLSLTDDQKRSIELQIFSYCVSQKKANMPVHLTAIAPLVDPKNESGLIEFINEKNMKCPDVFDPHPQTLKKLKRYEYKARKWSLSFDHDLYQGGTITYNKDHNTITIREVPEDFEKSLDLTKNE